MLILVNISLFSQEREIITFEPIDIDGRYKEKEPNSKDTEDHVREESPDKTGSDHDGNTVYLEPKSNKRQEKYNKLNKKVQENVKKLINQVGKIAGKPSRLKKPKKFKDVAKLLMLMAPIIESVNSITKAREEMFELVLESSRQSKGRDRVRIKINNDLEVKLKNSVKEIKEILDTTKRDALDIYDRERERIIQQEDSSKIQKDLDKTLEELNKNMKILDENTIMMGGSLRLSQSQKSISISKRHMKDMIKIHIKASSRWCLNLHEYDFNSGAIINLWEDNSHASHRWQINDDGTISPYGYTDFCLNLHEYKLENGATVNLWKRNGHRSQQWQIDSDGTISSYGYPRWNLNLHENKHQNGATINLWEENGDASQQWIVSSDKKPANDEIILENSSSLEWYVGKTHDLMWDNANSLIGNFNKSNEGAKWRFPSKSELDRFLRANRDRLSHFNSCYLWLNKQSASTAGSYRVSDKTTHFHNVHTKVNFRIFLVRDRYPRTIKTSNAKWYIRNNTKWYIGNNEDITWDNASALIERLNQSSGEGMWRFPSKSELDRFLVANRSRLSDFTSCFLWLNKKSSSKSGSYHINNKTTHSHNVHTKVNFRVFLVYDKNMKKSDVIITSNLEWYLGNTKDITWDSASALIEKLNKSDRRGIWRFPSKLELDAFLRVYGNRLNNFDSCFLWLNKKSSSKSGSYHINNKTTHSHNVHTKVNFRVFPVYDKNMKKSDVIITSNLEWYVEKNQDMNWHDAVALIEKLNNISREGNQWRFPSKAEVDRFLATNGNRLNSFDACYLWLDKQSSGTPRSYRISDKTTHPHNVYTKVNFRVFPVRVK